MGQFVCEQCHESVQPDAAACPHCGFRAGRSEYWTFAVVQVIGFLFTITIIGAVIGLPLQYWSWKRMRAAQEATVGIPAE